MKLAERLGMTALRTLDPERAHGLAIKALQMGLAPKTDPITSERLRVDLAGLALPNPLGLAAGFDKNATAIAPLLQSGFGFIEIGAVTPRPQPGNPKPRLFRLTEDRAAINRFGFNNEGMEAVADRLSARTDSGTVGINLGANKDSDDKAADFARVLRRCGPHVSFATVNVSSPNTEKLRDLQGKEALTALLAGVCDANASLQRPVPIFLKVAPDLTLSQIDEITQAALETGIDGLFATNTTLSRNNLKSQHKDEAGGLSGAPLTDISTQVLARFAERLDGRIPLVGIGGISDADEAYAKIKAGATAVQLYTALVYGGMSLVGEIVTGLDQRLARDGYASVTDAVGTEIARYAA